MKKHLSALLASMAVITLSAEAQVTPPKEITESVPGAPPTIKKARPAAPEASANVREGGRSTTTTEVSPTGPSKSTTTTEVAPSAPARSSTTTEVAPTGPGKSRTTTEGAPAAPATSTTVTGTTAITTTHQLDPVVARRHLSVAPQTVTITPEQRTALQRTVTIESRSAPVRRVYNVERNVVIVEEQGKSMELPYVTVPVLFVVDTAELLDAESRNALTQTAEVINEVVKTDPNARFDIEGHTSTEGTEEHNLELSAERATRVFAELTQRYSVPPTALTAHGYGENFPMFPGGAELELQADRRVLVVRTR